MGLPDWDVFRTYRQYGGYNKIAPVAYKVDCKGQLLFAKDTTAMRPARVGRNIRIVNRYNYGYFRVGNVKGYTLARVLKVFRREDFMRFNLAQATPDEIEVVGHLMCGAPLHGQLFGELFGQLAAIAKTLPSQ